MSKAEIKEINLLEPHEDLIGQVEKLLEHAKSGELTGIVYVSQWQDSSVSSGWTLKTPRFLRTIIGEVEILKTQLIHNSGEDRHL